MMMGWEMKTYMQTPPVLDWSKGPRKDYGNESPASTPLNQTT